MQYLLNLATNLLDDAAHWYGLLSQKPWWPAAGWAGAVILGLITLARLGIALQQYRLKKRAELAAKSQDEELRLYWFQGQDFVSASKDYLIPYCSNIDPSDREDLRNTVAVQEPIFDALERELAAEDRRHILVLADSGMGKTTLLLNLVAREQRHRRFALVPLGEADALERLDAIPNKRDTVLLLDAFDEDPRAIEDAEARMERIMTAAAPFKCVVMTCRTQFFPSDDKIPHQTGIKRLAARRAGSPVIYQWLTVYLQPFNHQQINQYIRQAIPWWRIEQRGKAKRKVYPSWGGCMQAHSTGLPGMEAPLCGNPEGRYRPEADGGPHSPKRSSIRPPQLIAAQKVTVERPAFAGLQLWFAQVKLA